MEKGFKKLLGTRVYLKVPKRPESTIIVPENTKEALEKELFKSLPRIEVYAIGQGIVDPDLVEGCFVLVEPSALVNAVTIPSELEEHNIVLVPYFSLIHIW